MSSLNRATLIGNLGKEPEIRSTQDGREIATLTLATSESWKDKNSGERKTATEWHRVVIFNEGIVRVAKNYLHKGSKVLVEGSLKTRKWTDAQGVENYSTEIVLQAYDCKLVMLDGKKDGADAEDDDNAGQPSSSPIPELDQQIPY